jgi:hypothetical protein
MKQFNILLTAHIFSNFVIPLQSRFFGYPYVTQSIIISYINNAERLGNNGI